MRVYPNFRASAHFALLAAENQSRTTGVKQRQRRGAGLEFAELREYAQGDMPRHIDWKATARRRKLTTRAFRDEQDQQLVLLLDCGRRLRAVDDGQAHFDHALNAALLLAWVALRQGDRVGLLTFGGRDRFLTVGDDHHLVAVFLERPRSHQLVHGVVLGEQNPLSHRRPRLLAGLRRGDRGKHRRGALGDGVDVADGAPNRFQQLRVVHGLRQVLRDAELAATPALGGLIARADHHDGAVQPAVVTKILRDLEPVHVGHVDVEQDHGEVVPQDLLERVRAGRGGDDVQPEFLEDRAVREDLLREVVDDQDARRVVVGRHGRPGVFRPGLRAGVFLSAGRGKG